jgi:tetratricopeptide (TPR) repeat protein
LVTRYLAIIVIAAGFSSRLLSQAALSDEIRSAQSAGNDPEAAKLYGQLISGGTDSPQIHSNYGIMLHLAGRNREALEQFRATLRQSPDLAGANLFAGLAELDLGEPSAALPFLQRAQHLDPDHPTPFLALGRAYVATRNYVASNAAYSKAAELDGTLAEAWYGVGVTDRSLAEELLNQAARAGKINDESIQPKVHKLLDGALDALTRAVQLDPASARTHLLMGESFADAGKVTEAIPEYQTAIKLDPKLGAAYLGLATGYWKARQFDQATPLLERILERTPGDAEANGMLADTLEHKQDYAGAKRHAELALARNPGLIETRVVLARIYLGDHQPKLAAAELQKVLPADPDGSYHFLLYRAYREAGDEQGAHQALLEFLRLRNNSHR